MMMFDFICSTWLYYYYLYFFPSLFPLIFGQRNFESLCVKAVSIIITVNCLLYKHKKTQRLTTSFLVFDETKPGATLWCDIICLSITVNFRFIVLKDMTEVINPKSLVPHASNVKLYILHLIWLKIRMVLFFLNPKGFDCSH